MIKIIRDYWEIEDQIRPYPGCKVHIIFDVLTDENVITINSLKNLEEKILDLRIYGVNLGQELFYYEKNDKLIIDLGNLEQWTSSRDSEGLKKVRIDIKFTINEPDFNISNMDLGYESFLELEDIKLYTCSIVVPLGLKIDNNGTIRLKIKKKFNKKTRTLESSFIPKFIDKKDKKKRYTYYIGAGVEKDLEDNQFSLFSILNYTVVNEKVYYLISIVGFALLIISIFRLYLLFTSSGDLKFDIRFLAASIGFLGLFMGLMREGYEIPFRKIVYISILFLLIELALELAFLK